MPAITNLIWDWNGTLFDDRELCVEVIREMLARRGLPALSYERYLDIFTFPVRDYYRAAGFDYARDSFEELSVEFISAYESRRHHCPLQPGARAVLERLGAGGRRMFMLSANNRSTLHELVRSFALDGFFDHLMGLDNIYAHGKLELGRELMARIPDPPASTLLVGDTLHDVEVARDLGIHCLLVAHGHQSRPRLEASGAPVVDNLEEAADAIAAHG
jgi:phosphoglycolate phosphatase